MKIKFDLTKLFQSSAFLCATIGIPFCMFKILFGLLLHRVGGECACSVLDGAGWIVIIWACIDLIMNCVNIAFNLLKKNDPIEYCTIAQVGRLFKCPALFLAFDTLLSFSIICFTLWSGWIVKLKPVEAKLWYLATTINLISLAIVAIVSELKGEAGSNKS